MALERVGQRVERRQHGRARAGVAIAPGVRVARQPLVPPEKIGQRAHLCGRSGSVAERLQLDRYRGRRVRGAQGASFRTLPPGIHAAEVRFDLRRERRGIAGRAAFGQDQVQG